MSSSVQLFFHDLDSSPSLNKTAESQLTRGAIFEYSRAF
jgi:hypothetical protein